MNDIATVLPIARYRLEFEVTSPLTLPPYAGSTLRGAWGRALRALSCLTRQPTCDGCPLLHTCPYTAVFETRVLPGHPSPTLQGLIEVPRPYVLEPPTASKRHYRPGERLVFHTVLIGRRALEHCSLVIQAHAQSFQQGVGKDRGTAELQRVVHEGLDERVVQEGAHGRLVDHIVKLPAPPGIARAARLSFYTPLRLQTNGHCATPTEFHARKLLMALVRRVALLAEFHGAGPLAVDFKALAWQAESIDSATDLLWHDWSRWSGRQKRTMSLGGYLGEWRLTGDLGPFAVYLHFGQWLHVGKEATFGMGGYRLHVPA